MSTSDQNEHGPLTRKQLREIRLTGSTPVITPEDAAAAAAAPPVPPAPPVPRAAEPSAAEPIDPGPAPTTDDAADSHSPLTRRQVREQERARTGSVAVTGTDGADAEAETSASEAEAEAEAGEPAVQVAELVEEPQVEEQAEESEPVEQPEPVASSDEPAPAIVSGVPDFARPTPTDTAGDDDDLDDEIIIEPVSASGSAPVDDAPVVVADESAERTEQDDVAAVLGLSGESESSAAETDDVLADSDDTDVVEDARPTVNSAFGEGVLTDAPEVHTPFRPSFDELLTVGDSTGSQHSAPNALIFTPSPGDGSLSGPVASTGEILVTGSYELPQGMGSQGHAHGTTDGKDIDAVLIDGELPPASSPTPIAASAAVSTIKPAGEVIRPPAPEKGSRLTLVLTIIVGGLALALAVALVVAISTNVF